MNTLKEKLDDLFVGIRREYGEKTADAYVNRILSLITQYAESEKAKHIWMGKLEAYKNALLWTEQQQPYNKDALTAHGNAVGQIEYELKEHKYLTQTGEKESK